uniref:Fibronectin type-III domain-containing protein n=1 Tax=Anas zonorhyncha TaxID=75864 RepID=A0A8B9UGD1_9AVES
MGITVQNITGNTAVVIWPQLASCADSFYSVMYHPNWRSTPASYSRKSFQKEERVPASRSSFVVENLTPLTTYILCVTCQSANPSSDQCRVFNTLQRDPASSGTAKKELALGIWLASSLLLLVIAAVLLYGCLHLLCRRRRERPRGRAGFGLPMTLCCTLLLQNAVKYPGMSYLELFSTHQKLLYAPQ